MPDEYLVSYTTKLDLLNNNFGSSTAIVTSEDDGIFSRSYTSEQINNWANERWKVPVNKTFTLAFRCHRGVCGRPHIRNARSAHRGGDRNPDQGRCLRCRQGVAFRHGHQQRDGDRKDGRECEPLCLVRRIEHRRVADSRRAGRVRPTTSFRATATARSATGSLST